MATGHDTHGHGQLHVYGLLKASRSSWFDFNHDGQCRVHEVFWKGVDEKLERDPHYIPKIAVESQQGRGGVNWVKFMDTLEEMQYISVRDEMRTRIAAFYGVSNVFMMDTGKSGGLNNEGLQILRPTVL